MIKTNMYTSHHKFQTTTLVLLKPLKLKMAFGHQTVSVTQLVQTDIVTEASVRSTQDIIPPYSITRPFTTPNGNSPSATSFIPEAQPSTVKSDGKQMKALINNFLKDSHY
jgi:hypothetical protein